MFEHTSNSADVSKPLIFSHCWALSHVERTL